MRGMMHNKNAVFRKGTGGCVCKNSVIAQVRSGLCACINRKK